MFLQPLLQREPLQLLPQEEVQKRGNASMRQPKELGKGLPWAIFNRNFHSPWPQPGGTAALAVGWPIG
jgi:hypothetical protein